MTTSAMARKAVRLRMSQLMTSRLQQLRDEREREEERARGR